jgi:hypothetical protein
MLTVCVILSIWTILSIPMSVVLGSLLRDDTPPELVGMDGDRAVYRNNDGSLRWVSLVDRAAA